MSTPQLKTVDKYCRKWMQKLGLGHWTLDVRFMNKEESEGAFADCNGYCQWSEDHTHALIVISRDSEDWRHTAIHEVLHLRLDGHRAMLKKRDVALEVTINSLTKAFLNQ